MNAGPALEDRAAAGNPRTARWLSEGFEVLVAEIAARCGSEKMPHFDVVIIGSGYGGAIAAAELAGCTKRDGEPLKICVLERGNEYLAGMFPADMTELPAHLRMKVGGRRGMVGSNEGLFDMRPGADVSVLVANGLGGGSLINAGVMARPSDAIFDRWPQPLRDDLVTGDYFKRVQLMLGAARRTTAGEFVPNNIEDHACHQQRPLAKFAALQRLAPEKCQAAPITVAMADGPNAAGVPLKACNLCGDCATGCNFGAKDSLDLNLLVTAHSRRARIFTGATVTRLERGAGDYWNVCAVFTDDRLRKLHPGMTPIRATRVILAAGTLGSTEILLRSASPKLAISPRIGRQFSSNGDMLAFGYGEKQAVNAIARAEVPVEDRKVGPTITGMLDLRRGEFPIVVEEMAVPAGLRRLVEEVTATTATLHALGEPDKKRHVHAHPYPDPFAIDPDTVSRTSVIAMMGCDDAAGAIELTASDDGDQPDGAVRIVWPALRNHKLFEQQIETLRKLHKGANPDARVIANPVWQLLPENVQRLLDNRKGPLLTVHPLGGCAIGTNRDDGVVNEFGQVFVGDTGSSTEPGATHPNLVILDGSIIPSALGINPALTIAAVSLRAVEKLRADWGLRPAEAEQEPPGSRPIFREIPVCRQTNAPRPAEPHTMAHFVERLSGEVEAADAAGGKRKLFVELTLEYQHKRLLDLVSGRASDGGTGPAHVLHVDRESAQGRCVSQLRVFDAARYAEACRCNKFGKELDEELDRCAEIVAPLSGTLTILRRESSTRWRRVLRALCAWMRNRGLRDMWQEGAKGLQSWRRKVAPDVLGRRPPVTRIARMLLVSSSRGLASIIRKAGQLAAVASRAGEVRLFEYDLTIGEPRQRNGESPDCSVAGRAISGRKRITYSRRGNPWRQVMELELTAFPGLVVSRPAGPILTLDTVFLADKRIPLLRLVQQQDQVAALADLASFLGYFLRMFLGIHIWSFRKPDEPSQREPRRLPGVIEGLPEPHIHHLDVDRLRDGTPVRIRLTRYPCPDSRMPPLIMIHGYSASGTTFAHPAVRPNLASYFHERGRDVWILDMRTSSGMPTATEPWSFEEVAYADIPAAFDFVWRHTGRQPLDVIAHCMGSAMLSMAVLSAKKDIGPADIRQRGWPWADCFREERRQVPARIRRLALTQVGPLVVFSPANILRAYFFSYIQQFLPLENYRFRVGPNPSLTDQLIDRLLATLPYPDEEFDLENPPWPPWRRTPFTGTRHRMDALYGRDFKLTNINQEILDHIDDHFGPLSIDTLNQTIEFALLRTISDHRGRNTFVCRDNLEQCWTFPTLCLHGDENGLSDVKTLYRMKDIFTKAGREPEIYTSTMAGREHDNHKSSPMHGGTGGADRPGGAGDAGTAPGDGTRRFGHQDALIGTESDIYYYKRIAEFFAQPDGDTAPAASVAGAAAASGNSPPVIPASTANLAGDHDQWVAEIPETGPVIGRLSKHDDRTFFLAIRFGPNPVLGSITRVVFLPVVGMEGKFRARIAGEVVDVLSDDSLRRVLRDNGQDPPTGGTDQAGDADWFKMQVPIAADDLENADGLLVLLVYDQMIGLAPNARYGGEDTYWTLATPAMPAMGSGSVRMMSLATQFKRMDPQAMLARARQVSALRRALGGNAADLERGFIEFRRLRPSAATGEIRFALGSCQYPAGMVDRRVAYGSFGRLEQYLADERNNDKLRMVLLVGDQVYVDATAGLFDPASAHDRFHKPHHDLFRSRHVRNVLRRLPVEMMLDDHEIADDWEPAPGPCAGSATEPDPSPGYLANGIRAYLKYQRGLDQPPRAHPADPARYALWYSYEESGCGFFMLDTRTDREPRSAASAATAKIIGREQMEALKSWITARNGERDPRPAFIVSPSVLLPRHRRALGGTGAHALRSDTWDGYPASLHDLLAFLVEQQARRIVFLSGDLHLSAVTRVSLSGNGKSAVIHLVCSSGLYAPFPFANARDADLVTDETFTFAVSNICYAAEVSSRNLRGDGFALLSTYRSNRGWKLETRFQRAANAPDPVTCDLG